MTEDKILDIANRYNIDIAIRDIDIFDVKASNFNTVCDWILMQNNLLPKPALLSMEDIEWGISIYFKTPEL